jgi:DNA-binding winged helix-turn-helix (wHTH) protein/Tol biopolymer transport system component
MSGKPDCSQNWAFGAFELEGRTAELRRNGVAIRLQEQPSQLLLFLLQHAGQIVTREDLRLQLWPADTFVDFDHALNTAVMKLREALGDSSEKPLYIQTLPRKGYRFVAPVTALPSNGASASTVRPVDSEQVEVRPSPGRIQADANRPVETPSPAEQGRWVRRLYFRLALLGAGIVAVGGLAFWKTISRTPGTPKVVRFTKLTEDGHVKYGPLVSDGVRVYFHEWLPDGRCVIAQVSLKGGETIPLSVPLKQPLPFDLSKDGTELLVATEEGNGFSSLWVQPVAGGSPHRVGAVLPFTAAFNAIAAFGADETSVIYSQGHDVYSVNRDGSSSRKLLTVENAPEFFRFSPDARVLRFSQHATTHHDGTAATMTIMGAAPDGTGLHKLFSGCCGDWTPDGRFFIFVRKVHGQSNVWTLPEAKKFTFQQVSDVPTQLTQGPFDFEYPLPSKDGKEIFAIGVSRRAEVVRYDLRTHDFVPYLSGISAEGLAFSPDRQWVAYTSYPDGTLWRSRVDGSTRLQLTSPPMKVFMPRWSPDGTQIAFNAILPASATWNIYVISSAGGSPERLLPSEKSQLDVDWSPDGKSLIFGSAEDRNRAIYILDLKSRRVSTLPGSAGYFSPHWSPDGGYISGTIVGSQKLMLFDTSIQKWTKPCDCTVGYPMWSHDGKYLYFQYYPAPDKAYRIVRLRMSDRKIEDVAEISKVGRLTAGTSGQWFGLAPDESPLLARDISAQEIYALEMQWP